MLLAALQCDYALQGALHVSQKHKILNIEGVLPGVFPSQPITGAKGEGSLINMQSSFLACVCVCLGARAHVRVCMLGLFITDIVRVA